MKISTEQLAPTLAKSLHPIYIISGDELLLIDECLDQLRTSFKQQQFLEREVFHVEAGFDWYGLWQSLQSQSLFSDKKWIELRLPSCRPGEKATKLLSDYAASVDQQAIETVLIIVMPKLDARIAQTKWFKQLEKAALWIPIWPISAQQWPSWLKRKLTAHGLQLDPDAFKFFANRVEGNLLAAHQEVIKLSLLVENKPRLTLTDIQNVVVDSSRFNAFVLVDNALQGDSERVVWIMSGLKQEGVQPLLILGALVREIRSLCLMKEQQQQGIPLDQLIKQANIWPKNRITGFRRALNQLNIQECESLLLLAADIDGVVKGIQQGNAWSLLTELCLKLAGKQLIANANHLPMIGRY